MSTPTTGPDEPWTPVQAEAAIRATNRQMHQATVAYRDAGQQLIAAKGAYLKARTRAAFHPDCPKPERGTVTVGMREEWLDKQCEGERMGLFAAEIMRENAIEALRTSRAEAQAAMSLNASAREAYRMFAGT